MLKPFSASSKATHCPSSSRLPTKRMALSRNGASSSGLSVAGPYLAS
jgi:hypothetical protein